MGCQIKVALICEISQKSAIGILGIPVLVVPKWVSRVFVVWEIPRISEMLETLKLLGFSSLIHSCKDGLRNDNTARPCWGIDKRGFGSSN